MDRTLKTLNQLISMKVFDLKNHVIITKEMLISIFKDYTISFVGCVFEISEDLNDLKIYNNPTNTNIIKV
jgi:hypothetical protein